MKDETVVDGDILREDELVNLGEEALLLLGVEHVLQAAKYQVMSGHHVSHCPPGDQWGDGHLVTPVLAQQEHQQRQLRRVQQRPGLGIGFVIIVIVLLL